MWFMHEFIHGWKKSCEHTNIYKSMVRCDRYNFEQKQVK